jgi:protein-S-isoprenylcysteine O-methyltransferase Ste14
MRVDQDSAKIGFPPPLIYLGVLLLGFAWTGLTGKLGPAGTLSTWTGGAFLLLGALVIVAGTERFRNAGTDPKPWRSSTSLVTTGIYRVTRNPMYLGMAILYAGFAILFDSFTALLLLPVAILLIRTQVIAREERYLLGKFGADYDAYKQDVPRWF